MTTIRERVTTRLSIVASAAVLTIGALTGCTQPPPDISSAEAVKLQTSVMAVTKAAAGGQIAAAISALDALQAKLQEAAASGTVTANRYTRIKASIDLVRADLTAALPPTPTPTPTPTVTQTQAPGTRTPVQTSPPGKSKDKNGD